MASLSVHSTNLSSLRTLVTREPFSTLPTTTTLLTSTISHTQASTNFAYPTTTSTLLASSISKQNDGRISGTTITYLTLALAGFLISLALALQCVCRRACRRQQRSTRPVYQLPGSVSVNPYDLSYSLVNDGNHRERERRGRVGCYLGHAYGTVTGAPGRRDIWQSHHTRQQQQAPDNKGGKLCLKCAIGRWFNGERCPEHIMQEMRKRRGALTRILRTRSARREEFSLERMSGREEARRVGERRSRMETPPPAYQSSRDYGRNMVLLSYEHLGERRYFGGF